MFPLLGSPKKAVTIIRMDRCWQSMAKKASDLARLVFISLFTLSFCYFLYFILYQSFHYSVVLQTMLPEDFLEMLPTERELAQKEIVQTFQNQVQNSPTEVLRTFYQEIVGRPYLLFFQSMVWAVAFLIPGYFILKKLFRSQVTDFSEELSFPVILNGASHGFVIFFSVLAFQMILFLLKVKVNPGLFPELLFGALSGNAYLLAWSIYCVAILTGLFEETFFRGFLLKQFIIKDYAKEGLVFISVLFGILHLGPGTSIVVPMIITGVGIYFGYLYIKTGNIWISISCHITYNSLGLLLAFFKIGVDT